jgi:hypothetical protein
MLHGILGEIVYDADQRAWTGVCALPVFAEYGRLAPDNHNLSEPTPEFNRGQFPFELLDETADGPTPQQANVIRYVRDHEAEVCRVIMSQLVEACQHYGGVLAWLQQRRESRACGWLARLVGPEYKTPEDRKQAVRCKCVEVSTVADGDYAYVAFHFETIFAWETEHGLSVVFHPAKGSFSGNALALFEMH